ncbi:hypothetical protein AAG906_036893 [Vitis piasezkii]
MVETSGLVEKLPFALWAYRTSFRTSTAPTPYSLVYGMEAVLPLRLRWAAEGSTRAADSRAGQPRSLQIGDLVLKVIRGLIRDPRGKFRPNWSGPYFIRELTLEGAAWLMDLDGNRFSEPTNVDQLKKSVAHEIHYTCCISYMRAWFSDHRVFGPSFLSFLLPYHPSLRYVPCLKTTLRPWDQMSPLMPLLGQFVFGLPGSFMDPHRSARSLSLTGYFTETWTWSLPYGAPEIHPASSALLDTWMPPCLSIWEVTCAMMDDFMTFVLGLSRPFDAILGHIPFRRIFMDLRGEAYFGSDETYRS